MGRRNRRAENRDLPKYLYVEKRHGVTRYRFTLIDGTRFMMPEKFSRDEVIAAANEYNRAHRPDETLTLTKRAQYTVKKDDFNKPLKEWIPVVIERITSEEGLSQKTLEQTVACYNRLIEHYGDKPSKSLTLQDLNEHLKSYYGDKSKEVFNKHLGYLRKLFTYLADESAIETNFALNKKPRKVLAEDAAKTRQPLTIEAFNTMTQAAPLWLKTAMELALQSTHAVKEISRIKYRIKEPVEGVCGIVWLDSPEVQDGTLVYGTLYIHRAKAGSIKSAFVAIPVTQKIKEIVDLSKADGIACPYVVHRKPTHLNKISKECDHRYQVRSKYISSEFSKLRDNLGLFDHLEPGERPTFHEIRGLSARIYKDMGFNPTARMAHAKESTTEIYTRSKEREWVNTDAIEIDTKSARK